MESSAKFLYILETAMMPFRTTLQFFSMFASSEADSLEKRDGEINQRPKNDDMN